MEESFEKQMCAMKCFMDSTVDEIKFVKLDEDCMEVKVAGQTFGILGCCSVLIKNLVQQEDGIPIEEAIDFVYQLTHALIKCSGTVVSMNKEQPENKDEQFMDMFGNLFDKGQGEQ